MSAGKKDEIEISMKQLMAAFFPKMFRTNIDLIASLSMAASYFADMQMQEKQMSTMKYIPWSELYSDLIF